jgi:hypothetical protein
MSIFAILLFYPSVGSFNHHTENNDINEQEIQKKIYG